MKNGARFTVQGARNVLKYRAKLTVSDFLRFVGSSLCGSALVPLSLFPDASGASKSEFEKGCESSGVQDAKK